MSWLINLVEKKFGRLVVLSRMPNNKNGKVIWHCLCECGNTTNVIAQNLKNGTTRSCGCLQVESSVVNHTKHGHMKGRIGTSEYKCWKGITQRCANPNNSAYKNYGGRGIKVCDRWLYSFENFYEDMGEKPSSKHSIERNDVNGNYDPKNCRWATDGEQAMNKRKQKNSTSGHVGVNWFKLMSQWRSIINVNKKRIFLGFFENIEDAIEARKKAEVKYWNKLPS